ncbi:GNAT family N-acetyltransferase [Lysobacteraceae bacterium NML93-0399]|nr:GNAT family N-acetyltransferase [Xanthomonadaceae bacterium NML93-0399]
MSAVTVQHDPARHLFEIVDEGHIAHLEYREKGGVLTILHTIVPAPLAGRGLGAALVDAAVAHAQQAGLQVASECSYADHRLSLRGQGKPDAGGG